MAEYIEREAAIDAVTDVFYNTPDICLSGDKFEVSLRRIRAADVAPVVRGHWVIKRKIRGGFRVREGVDEHGVRHRITVDERYESPDPYCSECGKLNESVWLSYCPNCGAEMDKDGTE